MPSGASPASRNPFAEFNSTNPFRRSSSASAPPPLPPRKPSLGRGRPPSSASSSGSSSMYHPTSTVAVSPLIQQSLSAAAAAQTSNQSAGPTVEVIRRSSATHPVTPRSSLRMPGKFLALAKPFLSDHPGTRLWSCVDIFGLPRSSPYAMIILNQPITRPDVFFRAWSASALRLCADGGANRLYDMLEPSRRASYLPHVIKGDLDSLRPEVRAYYVSKGVTVKRDYDQDSTDLMKCITEVESVEKSSGKKLPILLIGGLSGRIDQTVHTMSLLHKLRNTRPETFVLSGESLAWVLDEGSHLIDIDHTTMGQTCGILPVGIDCAVVKTSGLRWNLDGETSFNGMVSTSNHLVPSVPAVHIVTSQPIMWCLEISEPLPALSPSSSRLHETHRTTDDISRGIRELGQNVARAADGVGKELGRFTGTAATRKCSARGGIFADEEKLVSSGEDIDIKSGSDHLSDAETSWHRLD